MKKSEMYREAALAVMMDGLLGDVEKIDIIVELMSQERHERWCEEQEAKKAQAEEAAV